MHLTLHSVRCLDLPGSSSGVAKDSSGQQGSWANRLISGNEEGPKRAGSKSLQAKLPEYPGEAGMVISLSGGRVASLEVSPMDDHNIALLDNVHPARWIDPRPQDK